MKNNFFDLNTKCIALIAYAPAFPTVLWNRLSLVLRNLPTSKTSTRYYTPSGLIIITSPRIIELVITLNLFFATLKPANTAELVKFLFMKYNGTFIPFNKITSLFPVNSKKLLVDQPLVEVFHMFKQASSYNSISSSVTVHCTQINAVLGGCLATASLRLIPVCVSNQFFLIYTYLYWVLSTKFTNSRVYV